MMKDWKRYLRQLRGTTVSFDLTGYRESLDRIARLEPASQALSDDAILERSRSLRERARSDEARDHIRHELFALAREAAHRALRQRAFDEQILAALALDDGCVVEMLTGEGKTLTAVMAAAMGALIDRGVHVLTFNDYLAARDAEWMGPVYRRLGLSVGCVQQGMAPASRRAAYLADVTYVTAKEAGFDHLRDRLVMEPSDLVHRPFHLALVDEADSIMIDEARVPLVIAGSVEGEMSLAPRIAALVAALIPGQHFDSDEYGRDVELTDAGIEHVERQLGCGSLHDAANLRLLTALSCALHAQMLLRRDVDYIVREGRIEVVDEFTGRVVPDRHWPDGLQAALEAKEGLERRSDGQILGSLTLQGFLRGYPRLCGMTGTAQTCAEELSNTYGLKVVVVPPHRPVIRADRDDLIFTHAAAKEREIVADICRQHATGRPILVGTASVTASESLAGKLRAANVRCEVLNAKNDAREAEIVAHAGEVRAVTISTNMAGRGTDIRLGGPDERERARVWGLGGLYVIGTGRHESSRVDLQLRGRSGRQGDPGESRFFVSLEDELIVRFGLDALIPARSVPERSDQPIDDRIVTREVARVQRIIEGQNYEIRRTLARYSAVLEQQQSIVADRRRRLLMSEEPPDIWQDDGARRAALVAAVGEEVVTDAERLVVLGCIDRAWRDHLALATDLRDGIHLVRLGGRDPLTHYTSEMIRAFSELNDVVDGLALAALTTVRVDGDRLDLSATGLKGPSSTWTYLVNDDPFKNRIGTLVTGPGGATVAIYGAAMLMPLFMAWGVIEGLFGRTPRRRGSPFGK
jgi:preprotein translocase subunit SecA